MHSFPLASWRTRARVVVYPLLVALPTALAGQAAADSSSDDRRSRFTATIAVVQMAQHVPSISPSRYRGTGVGATLRWERVDSSSLAEVSTEFVNTSLRSSSSVESGHVNRVFVGTLALTRARSIGRMSSPRRAAFVGLRLDGTAHADVQQYGPLRPGTDVFGYALFTASPVLRADFASKRRRLVWELSVPLIGLADIPYANAKAEGRLRLHAVTVTQLRTVRQHLRYHTGVTKGWGVVWGYDFLLEQQARYDTRTYARQAISVALNAPMGRRRP